jgi:hypothetical protein
MEIFFADGCQLVVETLLIHIGIKKTAHKVEPINSRNNCVIQNPFKLKAIVCRLKKMQMNKNNTEAPAPLGRFCYFSVTSSCSSP